MTNQEIWQITLGEIELSISKANFITWFRNTNILSNKEGKVVIGVPNGFTKEWLKNKYNKIIFTALRNTIGSVKDIANATEEELLEVKGVGKNIATDIIRLINASYLED